jgi:NADPH2:quinone reductase
MKEVVIHPLPTLRGEIRDVSIPIPAHDQVVIKVAVAGSNVKDWAHITARNLSINSGDDIAGTIHSLGDGVRATNEFNIGDRVAAFHPMLTAGGAYAEYATAPYHTVFKLPNNTTFEGMCIYSFLDKNVTK